MLRLKLMLAKEQKVNYDVLQMGRDFAHCCPGARGL
jgi:hypothetical protein